MKHKCFAAVVLAAALWLTGCGGAAAPAAPAGCGAASQSAAAAAVQTAQKERITDQYTLEKNVSGVWEADTGQYISVHVSVHVPQLECDSPDAVSLNKDLAAIYAADFREFENSEEAGQPGSEYPQIGVNWDAYWYGDCVSLVMCDRYDGTAPWYYSGWCFDFATGQQITTAEMLQRMGLDPDEVQQQVQRQAMQAFDREMAQGAYYEGLRLGGELSQMRMDTLEYNELENLCLLLPQQDQLVLRGKYSCEEGWQQLDMELSLPPADTPVLTDTYDGVQVQLEGTQATITLSPTPKTDQWGDIGIRVEQEHSYPILGAYNEYVDVCIGEREDGFFHPVVYLLTKDGVVEYVDVLRCLMFGNAMICQDPISFANNGTALERGGIRRDVRGLSGHAAARPGLGGRSGKRPDQRGAVQVSAQPACDAGRFRAAGRRYPLRAVGHRRGAVPPGPPGYLVRRRGHGADRALPAADSRVQRYGLLPLADRSAELPDDLQQLLEPVHALCDEHRLAAHPVRGRLHLVCLAVDEPGENLREGARQGGSSVLTSFEHPG